MGILPRHSLVLLVCSLVLVCLMLGVLTAWPVWADVGIQPILPGGSNIKPEDKTPIQMAAEKIVMTLRQGTDADNAAFKLDLGDQGYPWLPSPYFPIVYLAVAEVTADFRMANPTGEAVSMTVWFPLASALENARWEEHATDEVVPRIQIFQVSVDGIPLDFSVSELPNPQGEDKPALPWASFPVTFPAGEEVLIQVNYVFLPQPSAVDQVGMTLTYVFQTGAGWAGPIGKAELEVNLPYPASVETIGWMPEGGQIEGQRVSWTWENLEPGPQDDFSILLLRPERWDWLQAARTNIRNYPDYGQGWLTLAYIYERMSQGVWEMGHIIPDFGETYQRLGVQAAQEAARLIPEDIGPHYELAMLYASALEQNSSPEELQPVWDELKIMKELNPEEAQMLEPNVYDILEPVLYNDATATAEWAAWSTDWAVETADAALLETPSATPTQKLTPTSQPVPSTTHQPTPTALPTPIETTGNGQILPLIVATGIILLVVVGYLVLK